jgi:hypothetical protein
MGTSASNQGPKNINSLLPPWAPELEDDGCDVPDDVFSPPLEEPAAPEDTPGAPPPASDQPPEDAPAPPGPPSSPPSLSWSSPKTLLGKLASSGRTGSAATREIRTIGRKFVRAHGRAGAAANASRSGRRTAINIGGVLGEIARRGVAETFRRLGLETYLGQSPRVLLAALAEAITPTGALAEAAIARAAAVDALVDLFKRYDVEGRGAEALNALDSPGIAATMQHFVAAYINGRLVNALSIKIEEEALSAQHAVRLERDIKEFVMQTVRLDFGEQDLRRLDWNSPEAAALVDRIVYDGFRLLEVAR